MIGGMSVILVAGVSLCYAQGYRGAEMPWVTYEAETMKMTGTVLGPQCGPHLVEMESSGQRCVKLAAAGQLPFLANGAAVYGGQSNQVQDCLFTDITSGAGILISTTFPTTDSQENIDNNFSGTNVVRNCQILRSGGFDHVWQWRAAVQLCLDRHSISGLTLTDLSVLDSVSDGLSVVAPGSKNEQGMLSNGDLPGIKINGVHQVSRLAKGNTVFCSWTAGVKRDDWPTIVEIVEVTSEKKVIWAFREWTNPDLGPASCIQLLDEPGRDEECELQR